MKWTQASGAWLGSGPEADVVLSCRARLARNVAGFPFVGHASDTQRSEVYQIARQILTGSDGDESMFWVNLRESTPQERELLVERHLISRHHAKSKLPRAVAISHDETMSVMVNEEDHLRMQVLAPGLQLQSALDRVNRLDDEIEARLDYAFSSRWGYLTACPTNVGTGVRFSAMLHLPALRFVKDIDHVRRAAKAMHLAVRGYYGEGSEAAGDFYQVSNQITLGQGEDEILSRFHRQILPQIIEYERRARTVLAKQRPFFFEDRVYRAVGLLQNARLLPLKDAMKLLSRVRLGVCAGLLEGVDVAAINVLFVQIQPAHLRMQSDAASMSERELSINRAALLRKTMASVR